MTSPRLLLAPLVLLLACGDNGTGASTGTDSGSSGGQGSSSTAPTTNTTPGTASATDASGSASATDGSATGTATQATTEAITSGPASTSSGPSTDSAGTSTSTTGEPGSTGDASTGGGGSTGGGSTTTDGGSTTGDGSTGGGSTGDPVQEGMWLTMLEDTSSPTRLYKIDLETGAGTLLCSLDTSDDYNTSTFSRDGKLFTANASTKNLEIIDPCTCKRTVVGPTKVDALPGITADQALGLYGMDTTLDNLVSLNTDTGNATVIGALGINWGTGGLTWSDVLKDTYAINGTDDKLYRINHLTGKATSLIQTNYNFGSVGIEWHPKTGEIYACSNPAELLLVSEKTGEVTVVGPMNLENKAAHCDNLAAPWVPVPCVDNK